MNLANLKRNLSAQLKSRNYDISKTLIKTLLSNSVEASKHGDYYYIRNEVQKHIDDFGLCKIKISFITSFVARAIENYLLVEGFQNRLNIKNFFTPFNNYKKELLDKDSDFYKSASEVIVIFLRIEDLFPDIQYSYCIIPDNFRNVIYNRYSEILENLESNLPTNSLIIIHTLNYPRFTVREYSIGKYGVKVKYEIDHINKKICELSSSRHKMYFFDQNYFNYLHGYKSANNEALHLMSQNPIDTLGLYNISKEYVRYLYSYTGMSIKCIAVDADDTLWGGTIGEDGIENIKIGNFYPGNIYLEFQKLLLDFYKKGIILILLSKNNEEDIITTFKNHPDMLLSLKHFAAIKVNWNAKAKNLQVVAKDLNIGLDSILFVDNSIQERHEMKILLPEVNVLEMPTNADYYKEALLNEVILEKNEFSFEDLKRNELYQRKKERDTLKDNAENLDDFFKSLKICSVISEMTSTSIIRTHDLVQRTNQFNLTTIRYSLEEIRRMNKDNRYKIYTFTYSDIYADDGIVGVIIIKSDLSLKKWCIETFLLSCRVIGKNLENSILGYIIELAKSKGIESITGIYIPSFKNIQVKSLYDNMGFHKVNDLDKTTSYTNAEEWELDIKEYNPDSNTKNICHADIIYK